MIEISAPWFDLMRMGDFHLRDRLPRHEDAAKWWLQHQRELLFTFGVLDELRLSTFARHRTAADGSVCGIWQPTKALMRRRPIDLEQRLQFELKSEKLRAAMDRELLRTQKRRQKLAGTSKPVIQV